MGIAGIGDGQNWAFIFSQNYRFGDGHCRHLTKITPFGDGLGQTCPKVCAAEHADFLLDAVQLDAAQLLSAAAHRLRHHQYHHHVLVPHHRLQSHAPESLRLCTV
eukprot:363545-Chlamydomonas_euryale.AAC.11